MISPQWDHSVSWNDCGTKLKGDQWRNVSMSYSHHCNENFFIEKKTIELWIGGWFWGQTLDIVCP